MSYLLQSKPKKNKSLRRAIQITIALVVFVFAMTFLAPQALPAFVSVLAKPVLEGKEKVAQTISATEFLKSRETILRELENLRTENSALRDKAILADLLRADNIALRELVGAGGSVSGVGVPVLVRPSQALYDTLVVSLPTSTRVAVGDRVVHGAVALGEVAEISQNLATIKLYSSHGMETEGYLVSAVAPIILSGRGGGNFSVRVPRDLPVAVGDVVTLGSDSLSALAYVGHIEEAETNSFKLVRLATPLNIFGLRWVEIIHDSN